LGLLLDAACMLILDIAKQAPTAPISAFIRNSRLLRVLLRVSEFIISPLFEMTGSLSDPRKQTSIPMIDL
jgi:hypothetical protein